VDFNDLIYFGILIGIICLGVYWRNKLSFPFILISFLVVATLMVECFSIVANKQIQNNSTLYHLFVPIEFILISCIYYLLYQNKWIKQVIAITGVLFFIFTLLNAIYWQRIDQVPFNDNVLASIIFIFYSFFQFFEILRKDSKNSSFTDATFWFNSAVLLFNIGAIIFWIVFILLKDNANFGILFIVFRIINNIFYILLGISIYIAGKYSGINKASETNL
jgi:hypothetical protein